MKMFEKFKNQHIQLFLLLFCMFAIGAVADGFGFFNWIINAVGIVLQIGAMTFIVVDFVLLFDSGLLASRKSVMINLFVIFISLVLLAVCWKLKMAAFLFTVGAFLLLNIIMLVIGLYRLSRLYVDVIDNEKKEKSITEPRGRFVDFFNNF